MYVYENGAVQGGGGSGATTFLGLTDTPSSFSGEGGDIAKVNSGESALEFVAPDIRKLEAWIRHEDVAASGVSSVSLGTLPANSIVVDVFVWVEESTNNNWSAITVGYAGTTTAFVSAQGTVSTGTGLNLFMMNEGVGAMSDPGSEHFNMQSSVEVFVYTNSLSGSGPSTGKVYVGLLYITAPATPS